MPVTVATVLSRIRAKLNEATARFYGDSAASGLIGWYNDGAREQHRIALTAARQSKRLGELVHPYLRKFATFSQINVVVGTQDYALPDDFLEMIGFALADASDLREHDASYRDSADDWFVRNVPQLSATAQKPIWSLRLDPVAAGKVRLVVYAHGDQTKPNAPFIGRLYYYREVTAAGDSGNVDLDDPYNEGPIWYAVGQAHFKRGVDPAPALDLFRNAAQAIFEPIAASNATQQGKSAAAEERAAQ